MRPIDLQRVPSFDPQRHYCRSSTPVPVMGAQSDSPVPHPRCSFEQEAFGHKTGMISDSPFLRLFPTAPFQTVESVRLPWNDQRRPTDVRHGQTGNAPPGRECHSWCTPDATHPLLPSSCYLCFQSPVLRLPFHDCQNQTPETDRFHPETEDKFQSHRNHPAFHPVDGP